jgi:hypothetical protein
MLAMGLPPFGNTQLAAEGNPEPQARETDSGKPVPVAVTRML